MLTNPLDVLKVRLQAPGAPPGLWAAAEAIVRADGLAGLTRGWAPAAARAATYGGLRLGLYTPLREALEGGAGGAGSRQDGSARLGLVRHVLATWGRIMVAGTLSIRLGLSHGSGAESWRG